MKKILTIALAIILVLCFVITIDNSRRIQKIEDTKFTAFNEGQIRKLSQEETIKIINQLVAQQQQQQ